MNISSDELDLAVLDYAVKHYVDDLSEDSGELLLKGVKAIQNQEPCAVTNLVAQLKQNPSLDRIYEKSLRDLRQGYSAQERAKSLVITAEQPLGNGLQQPIDDLVTHLVVALERLLDRKRALALDLSQAHILRALANHPLGVIDLAPTIGQPPSVTHSLAQNLWEKGYIDKLSAPPLYTLFPALRDRNYRKKTISPQDFLTLTSKGYFHLYPVFRRPEATASA